MKKPNWYLIFAWLVALILVFSVGYIVPRAESAQHVGATFTIVAACTVGSDPQQNHQESFAYWQCDNQVAFMLLSSSPGAQWLREIGGHIVDVKVTVIK